MLTCPYCSKPAMGHLKKALLGPARSVACQSCGKRVSVHWRTMMIVIPITAGAAAAWLVKPMGLGIGIAVVCFVAAIAIHALYVPIVPREIEPGTPPRS